MARQFLGLYLLIVFTLAVVSWGQDRLLQAYSSTDVADDRPVQIAMSLFSDRLRGEPEEKWRDVVASVAARTGISQDDARKRVDNLVSEEQAAEQKAKAAADQARKATALLSFYTFFSMLIGAFIASAAAALGGRSRDEY